MARFLTKPLRQIRCTSNTYIQAGDNTLKFHHARRKQLILALSLSAGALLSACGGGGDSGSSTNSNNTTTQTPTRTLRPLSAEYATRKAVAYSGYRGAERSVIPTAEQILEDLNLLVQGNFRLIRLFDSSDEHAKKVLQVIRDNKLDIKVQLGIWISGPKATQDAANQAEIERGVVLAKSYSDIVLAVSVGNETMVDWSGLKVPPTDMAAYISAVRERITQPVTTDDNWAFFANDQGKYKTELITDVVDFIAMHTYPLADTPYGLWDWKQTSVSETVRATAMMDAALGKAKADYNAITSYLGSKKLDIPIVIGETGWKSAPTGGESLRAHPVNQKMYIDRLASWTTGPKTVFYFEAFDEPWKKGDDGWGLFDVSRRAKYAIYDLYPASVRQTESYSLSDALYYKPATANPRVTASVYSVFADAPPAGAAVPTGPVTPITQWQAWEGTAGSDSVNGGAPEGTSSLQITPVPTGWGWGYALQLGNIEDLTNFNASTGRLNFNVKTNYAGKLEIGFMTGLNADSTGCDVYLAIASGEYGYVNDGAWHTVSIPITAIAAKAAPAYGQPASVKLDMSKVSNAFVIADRFGVTGNTATSVRPILIDNIYWSK